MEIVGETHHFRKPPYRCKEKSPFFGHMARSSQKHPTGPEGMNIQMLGNMNGGMQNMLLGPSFLKGGQNEKETTRVLPTKNADFCLLPQIKDICVDVVFGKDVDEIVRICDDMICVFIYKYHVISFLDILLTNMYNIYIYWISSLADCRCFQLRVYSNERKKKVRESDPWQHQCCICFALKNTNGEISKGKACHIQGAFC